MALESMFLVLYSPCLILNDNLLLFGAICFVKIYLLCIYIINPLHHSKVYANLRFPFNPPGNLPKPTLDDLIGEVVILYGLTNNI